MLHYNYSFKYGCLLAVTRSDYRYTTFFINQTFERKRKMSHPFMFMFECRLGDRSSTVFTTTTTLSLLSEFDIPKDTHMRLCKKGNKLQKVY